MNGLIIISSIYFLRWKEVNRLNIKHSYFIYMLFVSTSLVVNIYCTIIFFNYEAGALREGIRKLYANICEYVVICDADFQSWKIFLKRKFLNIWQQGLEYGSSQIEVWQDIWNPIIYAHILILKVLHQSIENLELWRVIENNNILVRNLMLWRVVL